MLTLSQVGTIKKRIKKILEKDGVRKAQLYIQELYYSKKASIEEYNLFHLELNSLKEGGLKGCQK